MASSSSMPTNLPLEGVACWLASSVMFPSTVVMLEPELIRMFFDASRLTVPLVVLMESPVLTLIVSGGSTVKAFAPALTAPSIVTVLPLPAVIFRSKLSAL